MIQDSLLKKALTKANSYEEIDYVAIKSAEQLASLEDGSTTGKEDWIFVENPSLNKRVTVAIPQEEIEMADLLLKRAEKTPTPP